jgi:UDP-N-acetylglucosamine/UDP-N-acetyl-alpha-D-glucosaminouronate 4-epimerase
MRTVLVTGGAGFIGSHLVEQLLSDGAAVRVLDNLSTGSLSNVRAAVERHSRVSAEAGRTSNGSRLEVIIGDIRDRELLRTALHNVKYVFHLAALPPEAASATGPGEIHAVNVEGTLNVLHGALTEGVWRVVVGSSSAVYGTPMSATVSEQAPVRPATLFAASKAAAETYCRAFHVRHQLDTVVLRYFTIYGPHQKGGADGGLVPNLIQVLQEQRPFVGRDDRNSEDFAYIDDAVAATLSAGRAPRATGCVINVGSGQMATIRDTMGILADLLRTPLVPSGPYEPGAQLQQMCADMRLAGELLNFTPRVSLVSGMARLVQALVDSQAAADAPFVSAGLNG